MVELSAENLKLAKELGYSEEQAREIVEKAGQVIPSLPIPDIKPGAKEGDKVVVTFDTNEVKTIQTKGPDPTDRKKIRVRDVQVTTVITEDGIRQTLWLTSESMKRGYLQLRTLHQNGPSGIKGVKVAIYKAKVNYPVFGEGIAYRMQEISEQAAKKIKAEQSIEQQLDSAAKMSAADSAPAKAEPEEKFF